MTEHRVYIPPRHPYPGRAGHWETWIEITMQEASRIVDDQERLL